MSEQIVTPDTAALTVPNKDAKINLLDLNRQQMREFFKNMGEKPFLMQILGGVLKTHGNWVWGDITSDERAVNGSGPC